MANESQIWVRIERRNIKIVNTKNQTKVGFICALSTDLLLKARKDSKFLDQEFIRMNTDAIALWWYRFWNLADSKMGQKTRSKQGVCYIVRVSCFDMKYLFRDELQTQLTTFKPQAKKWCGEWFSESQKSLMLEQTKGNIFWGETFTQTTTIRKNNRRANARSKWNLNTQKVRITSNQWYPFFCIIWVSLQSLQPNVIILQWQP